MIGKVVRGSHAGGLLRYLYGPGRANEHIDPHLVAGFGDPAELEPDRRLGGTPDLRRLAGLLAQPLAALGRPGYDKPVWHCSVRAAPGDRVLSDIEWAGVATEIMHRTGLAPKGDEAGVRWVAVRHADDHIHIVATLARQDGARPRFWNDFYRVREACRSAEEQLGLRATPPADRTAARRPSRAETEQAARRGWDEPPRVTLRRHVCGAAAGARTEREFFNQLASAGVLVRKRYSTQHPGQVTRLCRRPAAPPEPRQRRDLVRRREARRRPHLAQASRPLGTAFQERGTVRRPRARCRGRDGAPRRRRPDRGGAGTDLRARRPASGARRGAHPVLRAARSGPGGRRGVGGSRCAPYRCPDHQQQGAPLRRRRLRPRRQSAVRPSSTAHQRWKPPAYRRAGSCADGTAGWRCVPGCPGAHRQPGRAHSGCRGAAPGPAAGRAGGGRSHGGRAPACRCGGISGPGHPGSARRTCGGGLGDGARRIWPAMRPPRRRCLDAPGLPTPTPADTGPAAPGPRRIVRPPTRAGPHR